MRNYVGEIFVLFSFVMLGHYLGRTPLPYFYTEDILELEDQEKEMAEINVEIDSETEESKQEQNGSIED